MKIFIYTLLSGELRNRLASEFADHTIDFRTKEMEQPPKEFGEAEILMGNPPLAWMEKKLRLKFWQLDSAGFDQYGNLNLDAVVSNMGDFFAVKCAETMLAGILSFYRRVHALVKLQTEKKWLGRPLRYEMDILTGKRVIILGAGTIAKSIKKMLDGFDCEIELSARKDPAAGIHSKDELIIRLKNADLLINTLPGTAHHMVDRKVFDAMPANSLYATVGRGNTTDEIAMINALRSGKLGGAILDVTSAEPLSPDSPLWSMENVILTQHTAGGYKYEDEGKVELFISNMGLFLKRGKLLNQVDLRAGY